EGIMALDGARAGPTVGSKISRRCPWVVRRGRPHFALAHAGLCGALGRSRENGYITLQTVHFHVHWSWLGVARGARRSSETAALFELPSAATGTRIVSSDSFGGRRGPVTFGFLALVTKVLVETQHGLSQSFLASEPIFVRPFFRLWGERAKRFGLDVSRQEHERQGHLKRDLTAGP